MKSILAAKKKTIQTREIELPEPVLDLVRLELPAKRDAGKTVGEGVDAVPELVRLLREEAKAL